MIDLHTHSTASDGSLAPAALVAAAREAGVTILALTDHDTVAGIEEFLQAAQGVDSPELVAGVEISTRLHATPVHMLGLFIDPHCGELLDLLRQIRANRRMRNRAILRHLASQGVPIDEESLARRAGSPVVCRTHIALELVATGACKTPQDAFDRFIGRGRPAYSSLELPTANHAIAAIHAARGIAIWAHPTGLNKRRQAQVLSMVRQLKELGMDGLEAYYPHYTPTQVEQALQVARQCGLLVSGGSDFHGEASPGVQLGIGKGNLQIPEEVFCKLQAARR